MSPGWIGLCRLFLFKKYCKKVLNVFCPPVISSSKSCWSFLHSKKTSGQNKTNRNCQCHWHILLSGLLICKIPPRPCLFDWSWGCSGACRSHFQNCAVQKPMPYTKGNRVDMIWRLFDCKLSQRQLQRTNTVSEQTRPFRESVEVKTIFIILRYLPLSCFDICPDAAKTTVGRTADSLAPIKAAEPTLK